MSKREKINFILLLVLHARSAVSFSFEALFEKEIEKVVNKFLSPPDLSFTAKRCAKAAVRQCADYTGTKKPIKSRVCIHADGKADRRKTKCKMTLRLHTLNISNSLYFYCCNNLHSFAFDVVLPDISNVK